MDTMANEALTGVTESWYFETTVALTVRRLAQRATAVRTTATAAPRRRLVITDVIRGRAWLSSLHPRCVV
jgi:hypothetical protein